MTVLKWLLIVVSAGYVCGLLALFFAQRAVLFPVPTSARTTPQAAGQRIGRLILEAPYTSITDVAASAFWFAPVRLFIRDQFRSDGAIARVKVPLLVMHGALDPTIPVAFGERLFALANEPKRFVRLARGGHNDLDNFGAIEIARNFINLARG